MRGVEQPDVELVAHVRPGDFARQLDVEALDDGEALVDDDKQRRRVHERNKSDPYGFERLGHFRSSAAVMMAAAMSAIFFFSRIAALRINR